MFHICIQLCSLIFGINWYAAGIYCELQQLWNVSKEPNFACELTLLKSIKSV